MTDTIDYQLLVKYATHCAMEALYFEQKMNFPRSGVIYQELEYAAIDAAFTVLEGTCKTVPHDSHGMKLTHDESTATTTLIFASGREVERSENCEAGPGEPSFMFCPTKQLPTDHSLLGTVMRELENILYTYPNLR